MLAAKLGAGWGLGAGGWKLEAGSWKLEAGSWKLEAKRVTTVRPVTQNLRNRRCGGSFLLFLAPASSPKPPAVSCIARFSALPALSRSHRVTRGPTHAPAHR